MAGEDRLAELSGRVSVLAEELSDAAMDVLREALQEGGAEAADRAKRLERRLNRARAALERAARLLGDGAAGSEADADAD